MRTKRVIAIDVIGLEHEHLSSGLVPNISALAGSGESAKMETVFPSVTCTVQASILSGKYPNEHGIIANGLYDRNSYSVSFWEQPTALVQSDRIWDILKRRRNQENSSIKTGVLFFQNTMFANSDSVITPRPLHMGDGSMLQWCYSKPAGFYEEAKKSLGEFDLATYWGPLASARSSEWIGRAAEYTLETIRPELMLVYIPHIDYSAQRFGKNSSQVRDDLRKADEVVGSIAAKASKLGMGDETEFVIFSEYGFNDVSEAIPINVKLRDAGLLDTRTIGGKEYVDLEFSNAFAMADHQVAHVYTKEGHTGETRKVLEGVQGIERILAGQDKKELKIDHERSGELVAVSARDKWFSYYWWNDEQKAPPFAGTVDIHRKPGYDPLELFFDREKRSIPFDTSLIKGSHGRPSDPETGEGLAVYLSNRKSAIPKKNGIVKCVDIANRLIGVWE